MGKISQRVRVSLGRRIQKLRKAAGYSQEKLAGVINISRTHMGHVEQGRKSPSLEVMDKIARGLKIKVGELFK